MSLHMLTAQNVRSKIGKHGITHYLSAVGVIDLWENEDWVRNAYYCCDW